MSIQHALREFLTADRVNKDMSKNENVLFYWMFEVVKMSPTIKKSELDSIIECKKVIEPEVLASKVKEL